MQGRDGGQDVIEFGCDGALAHHRASPKLVMFAPWASRSLSSTPDGPEVDHRKRRGRDSAAGVDQHGPGRTAGHGMRQTHQAKDAQRPQRRQGDHRQIWQVAQDEPLALRREPQAHDVVDGERRPDQHVSDPQAVAGDPREVLVPDRDS